MPYPLASLTRFMNLSGWSSISSSFITDSFLLAEEPSRLGVDREGLARPLLVVVVAEEPVKESKGEVSEERISPVNEVCSLSCSRKKMTTWSFTCSSFEDDFHRERRISCNSVPMALTTCPMSTAQERRR